MPAVVAIVVVAALAAAVGVALGRVLGARRERARAAETGARHRALVRNLPDASVFVLDADSRFVVFEGDALAASGWQREEIIGRTLADVMPPERVGRFEALLDRARGGETVKVEWAGVRGGDFQLELAPLGDALPATDVVMVARNETERRTLARDLERQRVLLQATLNSLDDRVLAVDANGKVVLTSGLELPDRLEPVEWASALGLRDGDGNPLAAHESALYRAFHGETVRRESRWSDAAAGRRELLVSARPLIDAAGTRIGAMMTATDVTEQRLIEEQLRANEARYLALVQGVDDCVFQTDLQGRWTFLNAAWTRSTGFGVEETLGRFATEFVHPSDRSRHARAFGPLLAGASDTATMRHRYVTKDGRVRWGEVRASVARRDDGRAIGYVGVMQDVTEDERASRYAQVEQTAIAALAEASSITEAQNDLLEAMCVQLDWDCAELWRMSPDSGRLECAETWASPDADLSSFTSAAATLSFEIGDGLPGQAWVSPTPVWRPSLRGTIGFARAESAAACGLTSAVAMAVRPAGGAPLAVMLLFSRAVREPEPGMGRLLRSISTHTGQFLSRRDADERRIQHAADLSALARITQSLAGETDIDVARAALCASAADLVDATSVLLWEPAPGEEALVVTAAHGSPVVGMRTADGDGAAIGVWSTGATVFVGDLAADPRTTARWLALTGGGSTFWVPVVREERVVAVLSASWPYTRRAIAPRHDEILRLLASEAAATMERIDLLTQMRQTARTDALTGLANRRVWDDELDRELARAQRHGSALVLAMLDLDHFKTYNDTNGHLAGDQLLKATAAAWRTSLRPTDILARYGGEEFAVLLPHTDAESARTAIERMLAAVPLGQSASAGIAIWNGEEPGEALLARADAALYVAKSAGRARAAFAS